MSRASPVACTAAAAAASPWRVPVMAGEAGAGQVAFGSQHRNQVSGLVGIEQRQQIAGGGDFP